MAEKTCCRTVCWAMVVLMALAILLRGGVRLAEVLTAPKAEYVDTMVQYMATPGGQVPVQWVVRLRVAGEPVEAACMTECEALRLREISTRRRAHD